MEYLLLVGDEMDFHSFLGSVEYLHPNVMDGVKEGLTCRFIGWRGSFTNNGR